MSLFNQLGEFGLNQLIARRLTTPGPAPSPTVEPAIFPALVLENDREEYKYLVGSRKMTGFCAQALDVINLSYVCISNPVGTGVLAIITQMAIASAAATSWFRGAPGAGTLGGSQPTDTRWPAPNLSMNSRIEILGNAQAALPAVGEFARFTNATSSESWKDVGIVLAPGTAIYVFNRAVNNAVTGIFQWYERTAQPGEL